MQSLKILGLCACLLLTACAGLRHESSSNNPTIPNHNQATATNTTDATNPNMAAPNNQLSSNEPLKGLPTWEQRYQHIQDIRSWTLNGSVSIQQGGKSNIASLRWYQQQPQNYNLTVSGPMNVGRLTLNSAGGNVTMSQSGKAPVSAGSAEQLMQQQLGFQMPVSNMYYWVRGIPAPGGNPQMSFDNQNRIVRLAQQGWVINYNGYQNVRGYELPSNISVNNPRMSVRLAVNNWNI
jgi:outer membrane lipoprotein LolB